MNGKKNYHIKLPYLHRVENVLKNGTTFLKLNMFSLCLIQESSGIKLFISTIDILVKSDVCYYQNVVK